MNESTTSSDVIVDAKEGRIIGLIVVLESGPNLRRARDQLSSIDGVEPLSKSIFSFTKKSQSLLADADDFNRIVFVKSREIPRIRDAQTSTAYILLHYKIRNPSTQQKKKIERLIRHSLSIRLRPGVLLFPHLRSKDHRKLYGSGNETSLMDSKQLGINLTSLGAQVSRWAYLKPATEVDQMKIKMPIERMFLHNMERLESRSRELRDSLNDNEVSTKQLKKRFTRLASRYKEYKIKWTTISRIWGIEVKKSLKRIYNLLLNIRRTIKTRS